MALIAIRDRAETYHNESSYSNALLGHDEVTLCAIKAIRYYAGWGGLETNDYNVLAGIGDINADTKVNESEWAVVLRLFALFCEQQMSSMQESVRSTVSAYESMSRTMAEIEMEISAEQEALRVRAFNQAVITI